jgi:hypothetical protein
VACTVRELAKHLREPCRTVGLRNRLRGDAIEAVRIVLKQYNGVVRAVEPSLGVALRSASVELGFVQPRIAVVSGKGRLKTICAKGAALSGAVVESIFDDQNRALSPRLRIHEVC